MTEEENEIIELAESISLEYFPASIVDPEVIAKAKGITYDYDYYGADSFDGLIEHESGKFHIYMNLDQVKNIGRSRFTFSHELGHYFNDNHRILLQNGISLSSSSLGTHEYYKVEREANLFATNLLMPKTKFIEAANTFSIGMEAILGLSSIFSTSRMNAAFHYVNCDIHPCMLIKWRQDFTIAKSCLSASMQKALNHKKPIVKFNPSRSVTDSQQIMVYSSIETQFDQSISNLSSWAVNVPYGSNQDLIVVEQTLKLSPYGGLTLIFPTAY